MMRFLHRHAKLLAWVVITAAFAGIGAAYVHYEGALRQLLAHNELELGSPEMLWLALAVPLLWYVRIHTLSDLPWLQQLVGTVLRSLLLLAVIAALAEPRAVKSEPKKVATVFLVDASDSMPDEKLLRAREVVQQAWGTRGDSDLKLVVFAERPRLVPIDPEARRVPPIERPDQATGTDAQAALRMAYGLFPEGVTKRVVIVTDGNETRGNLQLEAKTARSFGIEVSFRVFDDVAPKPEMLVRGMTLPDDIKEHVPFAVTASLSSNHVEAVACSLKLDGKEVGKTDVELGRGATQVRFEDVTIDEGGERRVSVECAPGDPENDQHASNNRYETLVKVPKKPRVLYVEGEQRYNRDLLAALSQDFDVEARGPSGIPSTLAEMQRYDLIFVSDVPQKGRLHYENFSYNQMHAVEQYVQKGGGFVMAGGENGFGPGGYTGTYLERNVLPVRLDVEKQNDTPGLALELVIDRSGSMSGQKIELAKEAAKATLEVLQRDDRIGVVAFDNQPIKIVPLQAASNRLRIIHFLSRITAGGGTNILPALEMAHDELRDSNAQVKHVILLTDGQSNRDGIETLVGRMYRDSITVSTVAVGESADRELLEQIAGLAGGRYYSTNNANNIPKIFMKETSQVSRRALVEEHFRPRINPAFARLQMLKGVGSGGLPALLGYVSTKAKPRAEVILTSHLGEPVLARWRLGLGWVVVWTSDVKARWSYPWVKWKGYAQFWRQLVRDAMRFEQEHSYEMAATIERDTLEIKVDAVDESDRFVNELDSVASIKDPDGETHDIVLTQSASGRYEGTWPLTKYGPYRITATQRPHGAGDSSSDVVPAATSVSYPYPVEHALAQRDNDAMLQRVADATGGSRNPTPETLFRPTGETFRSTEPRYAEPLYLALVLLVLDVLLRRVRLWGKTDIPWKRAG